MGRYPSDSPLGTEPAGQALGSRNLPGSPGRALSHLQGSCCLSADP